ncbi:MAG: hypothetical protein ACI3W5_01260 [Faecousia sp.]
MTRPFGTVVDLSFRTSNARPYHKAVSRAVGGDAHIAPQDAEQCFYGTAANP